jgi:putative sterol carrier protein
MRMSVTFPSPEWLTCLSDKLNSDEKYAQIAKKWEGDICFVVEPCGPITERFIYYVDLWHGKCLKAETIPDLSSVTPKFVMTASYDNIAKIMLGELDPMQALMTRKLLVRGSMAYMMRNVPVVLDFVRCARAVTSEVL